MDGTFDTAATVASGQRSDGSGQDQVREDFRRPDEPLRGLSLVERRLKSLLQNGTRACVRLANPLIFTKSLDCSLHGDISSGNCFLCKHHDYLDGAGRSN